MKEQLDLLDEFEGHSGARGCTFYSVSPQFERAKAARETLIEAASEPSPAAASAPEAAPAPSGEPPVLPRVISTGDELVDLIRRRRDELGITHETIDHLTGWASGYASKLLSPEPMKGLGKQSLSLVLDALALGIARIEFVEDPTVAARMRPRWLRRKRPQMRPRRTSGALLAERQQQMLKSTSEDTNDKTTSELPPKG